MKYLILTYASQEFFDGMTGDDPTWTADDLAEMGKFMEELNDDLRGSGEFIEAVGLEAPAHTRRVRLRGGVPVVTDGPYAETQEVLAGYWLVDCAGFDRATEIAGRLARCPGPDPVIDVRPVMGTGD
ncbi:MAG: YciI family protein [Stackebrandtia sp.]